MSFRANRQTSPANFSSPISAQHQVFVQEHCLPDTKYLGGYTTETIDAAQFPDDPDHWSAEPSPASSAARRGRYGCLWWVMLLTSSYHCSGLITFDDTPYVYPVDRHDVRAADVQPESDSQARRRRKRCTKASKQEHGIDNVLHIQTYNGSCFQSFLDHAEQALASGVHVLLGQELKLDSTQAHTASSQAKAVGLHGVHGPCDYGPSGGKSAGVGVFTASHIGSRTRNSI